MTSVLQGTVDKPTNYWHTVVITALLSILITSGGHFLLLGSEVVVRSEVEAIEIKVDAQIEKNNQTILKSLEQLNTRLNGIDIRLSRIEGKLSR